MLYKYGGKKTCYFASKLCFIEVLFGKKEKLNLDQYLKPKGKGKTKTKPKFFVLHGYASQLISVNNMISLCFLFRILLKKF